MKKFEGILLCTDLDGTLLKNDKTISKENLEAIAYFQKEGGYFTFITGRVPLCVKDILEMVQPNCPIGCINGGGVYDYVAGKYLWIEELSKEVMELVAYAEQEIPEIGFQVNTFDNIYFCRENSAMEHFRLVTGTPNLVCEYRDVKEPVAKILFGDHREENILKLQRILTEHPLGKQYDFIRSEKNLYEILPKGISKGTALLKVAEILGVDMDKTIAVGDYNNDIQMIKAAKAGFAVANARPEVKEIADFITVSNEEHAIADIINRLDMGGVL